jgi:uncharacterized linocin/CFP29 family protein
MNGTELGWTQETWQGIYASVLKEAGKVRVAQKIFPTSLVTGDPNQLNNEIINFGAAGQALSVAEGDTKPYVEIYREFSLTTTQVRQEETAKLGETLARMSAKEIALAEDAYIFQDSNPVPPRVPSTIQIFSNPAIHADNWRVDRDLGLLAEANPANANDADPTKVSVPIAVPLAASAAAAAAAAPVPAAPAPARGRTRAAGAVPAGAALAGQGPYGEETFKAVTRGIANLLGKAQAPPFALVLPTRAYADTYAPPTSGTLITTADRIKPLVDGGYYSSGMLPVDEGLLIALGGEPVRLFVGRELTAEYIRKDGGSFFIRVVARINYVVRDPRSLQLLKFS